MDARSDTSKMLLISARSPEDRIRAPYNIREDICIETWKNAKLLDRGKKTFLDDVIKYCNRGKLSPVVYASHEDWAMRCNSKLMHGHMLKNRISPPGKLGARETLPAEIMRKEKLRKISPPWAYNNMPNYRVL